VCGSKGDLLTKPSVKNGHDGTRLYTVEVNSGEWFERTYYFLCEGDEYGRDLWCIMFYIDGTNVTSTGSRSMYPLWLCLANLRSTIRQSRIAWICLGLIPELSGATGYSGRQEVITLTSH
jgi:hypothetical protein